MLLNDLSKLIKVAEVAVPISDLHLDGIRKVSSTLLKVKEVKEDFYELKSLCKPLRSIPLVNSLPLIKELFNKIDRIDTLLKAIDL